MKKFSDILAEKLIATHGNRFEDVIVILPGLQAGKAILQSLRRSFAGAMWLPEMMVMPEFVSRLSDKKSATALDLVLLLYEAYVASVSKPDDFATFCTWAPVVLKDFQDIDQYLADPIALFGNLRDIEQIEHWSLSKEVLSPSQEKYLGFWSEMGATHQKFMELRTLKNVWSYGVLVRKLPEWKSLIQEKVKGKTIWFAGLTAFTPAEEKLLFLMEELCSVHVCWDVDAYYFNDPMNEAGSYLRRFAKRSMTEMPFTTDMTKGSRHVEVIEAATPTGEVLALCDMLKRIPATQYNASAVVLADTGMVQSLLYALNDAQIPVQTAMGLPLKNITHGQWMGLLMQIRSPARRGKIHFKTFLEWLALSSEFGLSNETFAQIRDTLIQQVILFPGLKQCMDLLERFAPEWPWKKLLESTMAPKDFMKTLGDLLIDYQRLNTKEALKQSATASLLATLNELIRLIQTHVYADSFEVIKTIWQQLVSREEVRFESELQDGIKVMSMVETRSLDFEYLYILGANEDRFPGSAQEQTFIPWDVRGIFHLPLPDERDATFAYNFYRLIQRPSRIHFFHSAIHADYKSSEQSRFIAQLNYEWPFRNKAVHWEKHAVRLASTKKLEVIEKVPNNAYAQRRLDVLFAQGLSPSAMGKFNRCPLDFYYRYIIGLGEADELEEQMSAATFGSVIHDVLESFYKEYIGTYPRPEDFDALQQDLKSRLIESIARLYSTTGVSTGFNLLATDVAAEMLTGYLRKEKERCLEPDYKDHPILIRAIEFWMERELPVAKYNWDKPIRLRGKGDRLEEIDGIHYIIDYKTGKVDTDDFMMDGYVSGVIHDAKRGKLLQLMAYIYMYAGNESAAGAITAGFFSFVKPSAGYSFLQDAQNPDNPNSWLPEFEKGVVEWVKNVYELPHFEHNPSSEYCQYCQR